MDPIVMAAGAAGYLGLLVVLVALAARYGPRKHPENEALKTRILVLEQAVEQLPKLWVEETQRANRHRARAEQAERRHRQQLEELGELELADPDIHPIDAGRSGAGGVPTVRQDVGTAQPENLDQLAATHAALIQQKLDPYRRVGK